MWVKDYITLKVPYYEKQVFSGLYIYKLVPEPVSSQNDQPNDYCIITAAPPTGKTVLLQPVAHSDSAPVVM